MRTQSIEFNFRDRGSCYKDEILCSEAMKTSENAFGESGTSSTRACLNWYNEFKDIRRDIEMMAQVSILDAEETNL